MDGVTHPYIREVVFTDEEVDRGPLYSGPIPLVSDHRGSVAEYVRTELAKPRQANDYRTMFGGNQTGKVTIPKPPGGTPQEDVRRAALELSKVTYKTETRPVTFMSSRSVAALSQTAFGREMIEHFNIKASASPRSRYVEYDGEDQR